MRKLSYYLLFSHILSLIWTSDVVAADLNRSQDQLTIRQWTTDEGLPSNNMSEMLLASNGLMWLTSYNGIIVYDSETMNVYDVNNLPFLETDGFTSVIELKDGSVLLGGQGSGLIKYQKGIFSKYEPKGGIIPKSIRAIFECSTGKVYVGTINEGLYVIDNDSAYYYPHPDLEKATVRAIMEDGSHRLWIGTEGHGVFVIENDKVIRITKEDGLLSNDIIALTENMKGDVFAGSARGLQKVRVKKEVQITAILDGEYVNDLLYESEESIWFGTEKGIANYNPTTGIVEWIYAIRGTDLIRISSMNFDDDGSIWLTSNRSGLLQIKESMVSTLTVPNLSGERINVVSEGPNGQLIIGSDMNSIDRCKGEICRTVNITTKLLGNGVRDIYYDTEGAIWLATYVGIIRLKDGQETVFSTATGMPADNFRSILKDKSGFFWFGTRSGGLVKFKDGEIVKVYSKGNGLSSNFVFSTSESENGDIWIGTHGGGLSVIDSLDKTRIYNYEGGNSGILIFNIDFDASGVPILSSNLGPLYLKNNELKLAKLQKDQRSRTYFDLLIDDKGDMWFTTNSGILRVLGSDWTRYMRDEITEIPIYLIDENSGMSTLQCTGATKSTKGTNGTLYIPTSKGVCIILPHEIKDNCSSDGITIRHLKVDNSDVNLYDKTVRIAPGAIRYVFEFSLLSYDSPDRNRYKYKLEGIDQEWSEVTYDGKVEYTNLPPGKFKFQVVGSNDGQHWSANPGEFEFTVLAFFYQTKLFYVLIIFLIIFVAFLFFRWRIRFVNGQNLELKKVNAELDRFVYSASHELRSPLTSILGLINIAHLDGGKDFAIYLGHIEQSVKRLDTFIQDIIDFSRNARVATVVEPIDIALQINDILNDISYIPNFEKIKYEVINKSKNEIHNDAKRFKIVLSNLITNAFKHHAPDEVNSPSVIITILDTKKGAEIVIKDNGPGIPRKERENIFKMFYRATTRSEGSGLGLYIVKEIVENIDGSINLMKNGSRGSKFTLRIPNKKVKP